MSDKQHKALVNVEEVKRVVHRWKFTCTIPNEDFEEIINLISKPLHDQLSDGKLRVQLLRQDLEEQRDDVIDECVEATNIKCPKSITLAGKGLAYKQAVIDIRDKLKAIKTR